ncbi:hypothetical protein QWT69_02550 [Sporosarcina oncorhynchi]|uniref:Lipoprotein n=1 Tax=Sporosarcina oncorhynchi TaxID=3056444 RepID=A0ABZ0L767_9BACL|nr:hypothetical protein [Sporosarcina sp. T2O-4]WOV88019.1 hypothetical protein QWT69_02550 [Sporosarcina sp. T2O-4]
MFKKAIPLALVTGLALAGCGNNDVPSNNETPMERIEDDMRDVTPRVNNGAGPDMDGVENGRDRGNGVNDGIINDDNRNNGTMDGMNNTDDGIINDDNITNPNNTNKNRDQKNGMNNNR